MVNSPITAAAVRRAGISGLGDRCRTYAQTGVVDPYFSGIVVFVVTTGLCGIANAMDYWKKKKTGKEAISDTFKSSGKVGVCSVVGITAGNGVAGAGLVLIAPSVLPIAAGVTATFLLKRFWDRTKLGTNDVAPAALSAIS
ncbi:MAG: hypothetical protein WCJ37_00910 [Syntrophus sp. (in: bacteria)]